MQEINDLKNIVIQSLESKGILSQLRAQIRSSVFKIIEDQESKDSKNPAFFWENPLCQKIHDSEEGCLAIELMHEFFEFFRMDYTNNVFVHESNYKETFKRDSVKTKLHINDQVGEQPLLILLLKQLLEGTFQMGSTDEAPAQKETMVTQAKQNQEKADRSQPQKDIQEKLLEQAELEKAIQKSEEDRENQMALQMLQEKREREQYEIEQREEERKEEQKQNLIKQEQEKARALIQQKKEEQEM